jgi:aminopeptidase N
VKFRTYARGLLNPALARIGWDPRPSEGDNVALMRAALLGALGQLDDPQVAAEARRRFEAFRSNPASLSAAARRSVLGIVARDADAADWESLHALAKTARTELERREFYTLLGQAEDPALARKALDLAVSGEPAATTAPSMIQAVAGLHPGMAFDFATANWVRISAMLEPDTRAEFVPRLVADATDDLLLARLDVFAERNIPATARSELRKAKANVLYLSNVRRARLPEVDRWLASGG